MAAAFLVLSAFLLSKFRSISNRMSVSGDVGKNLWSAFDARLKKQDERILDVMAKVEVLLSKASRPQSLLAVSVSPSPSVDIEGAKVLSMVKPGMVQVERRVTPHVLEPTEKVILQLLSERSRTSVEIKSLINKSREHTARLMKSLFERGLVVRDDSKKPFVYQVTERGRVYFSEA